jgi:hypothetical protein
MGLWASGRGTPAAKSLYRSIFLDDDILQRKKFSASAKLSKEVRCNQHKTGSVLSTKLINCYDLQCLKTEL